MYLASWRVSALFLGRQVRKQKLSAKPWCISKVVGRQVAGVRIMEVFEGRRGGGASRANAIEVGEGGGGSLRRNGADRAREVDTTLRSQKWISGAELPALAPSTSAGAFGKMHFSPRAKVNSLTYSSQETSPLIR